MKKILLLICATTVLFSCSPVMYREAQKIGDFRKYTAEKFVVSPVSDGFKYEPIGEMEIVFYPGYILKKNTIEPQKTEKTTIDAIYGDAGSSSIFVSKKKYEWFTPTYDYILGELVSEAKKMGATGLLNLEITEHNTKNKYGTTTTYTAKGFAVTIL